jgi:peptidoglycan/xylan/chitin deacetylase (PgdA/CDA1 family)
VLTVAGQEVDANGLSTVAEALSRAGVVPKAGSLLGAATGQPIEPGAFPATIRVNGVDASLDASVHPGDILDVSDGKDVTEEIVTVREPAAGGVDVVEKGAKSGQVVSRHFDKDSTRHEPGVAHVAKGTVALTFDDGPQATFTPQVLDLLAKYHVKATFCIIGLQADKFPALVKRISDEGHALCNHTQNHDLNLPKKPVDQIHWSIATGKDAIVRASGGKTPTFYRAPGGNLSDQVNAEAAANGETVLKWSVDTEDWKKGATKASILSKVDSQLGSGGIILMHDGGGERQATIAALETLLKTLPAKGFQFVIPAHN